MAHRDRSQGFGFVYVDIKKLLSERDEIVRAEQANAPVDTKGAETVRLNSVPQIPGAALQNPSDTQGRSAAIQTIRENLDRLQALHHRLHSMLEELNTVADRKKKN